MELLYLNLYRTKARMDFKSNKLKYPTGNPIKDNDELAEMYEMRSLDWWLKKRIQDDGNNNLAH